MTGPLQGVRVFDMTHAAVGPWGMMILAALGANVIKVENPQGDSIRQMKPRVRDLATVYMHCNLGKKGIFLDLKSSFGKEVATRLLKEADIFAENMKFGTVARLGFGYEDVSHINPQIIYGNFQGYGDSGPFKNWGSLDQTSNAFSGAVSITGRQGGAGEFRGTALHDLNAGSYMALVNLLGLLYRERTGEGVALQSPQIGASISIQASRIAEFLTTGEDILPMGSGCTTTVPHRAFLCQDRKWLALGVVTDHQWRNLCYALNSTELLEERKFETNEKRVNNRAELEKRLKKVFLTKPSRWWTIKLRNHKVPVSLIYKYEDIPDLPQVRLNKYFVNLNYPMVGKLPFANLPFQYSKTPITLRPGPWPGSHTEEVVKSGWGDSGPVSPKGYFGPSGSINRGVLDGLTVVDLTEGLCGPFASLILADSGAKVIKVESLQGDYTRRWYPITGNDTSAVFSHLNRNKDGVRIDISEDKDRKRLLKLLSSADVIIEEQGQKYMESLGFGYKDLEKINNGVVYCTISPFGEKGPLKDQPASELVLQAMSDTWAWCDYLNDLGVDNEEPVRMGPDMASLGSSIYVVQGILGALYHKWRTNEGQHVVVNMLGTLLHQRGDIWTSMVNPDEWSGFRCESFTAPPEFGYKTADKRIMLTGVKNRDQFEKLLKALGMERYLKDPLFQKDPRDLMGIMGAEESARLTKPIWEEFFKKFWADDLSILLNEFGSIASVVNTYEDLSKNSQVDAIGILNEIKHDGFPSDKFLGFPWRIKGTVPAEPFPYREVD